MESYQFIKQIGQGNYGEVWLVKCSETKKKYVLKRFDLHHASKREQRSAFLEAQLLSTLRHPNIVTYLDSFYNSKGNLFIVMGYCECGDLSLYIRNRKGIHFEEKEIINWFVQICLALKYLHDKNILHRDLKTENIFLTKSKLIKVGDLGIARVLKAAEEMATTLIGTPYYMSPEIFSGKPYNQKSDVWALGCCMYEIATLERAFNAQDIHTLMQKVVWGKVSSIPNIYTPEFFDIISSMLNHDPEKRPSINELLLDDFIRKYILLFLQESPVKCNSKMSGYRSTPTIASNSSPDCKDSTSHSIIVEGASIKMERKIGAIPNINKIPDSNGNSDGNDNSQQAMNKKVIPSTILPQLIEDHKSESSCYGLKFDSQNSVSTKVSSKHNGFLNHRNSFKENLSPSNTKFAESSAENRSLIAQRLKSEQSFNLLNQLTHTIKNSRFQNGEQFSEEQLQSTSRMKYCEMRPPKSAEELYTHSKIVISEQLKRNAISAKQVVTRGINESECHLPQISKVGKSIATRNASKINLPCIQNSESVSYENCSRKSINDQLQNSPAHQRRRKQIANKLLHSPPTSMGILSMETVQK